MAQPSERIERRRPGAGFGLKKRVIVAAASVALLAAFAAPGQNSRGEPVPDAIADAYNVGYLLQIAEMTQDPTLKNLAQSQAAAALNKFALPLGEMTREAWRAYRTCLAMQHPTEGNSGELIKLAKMFDNRKDAVFGIQPINDTIGDDPDIDTAMSAPTGEASDAAKGAALDVANAAAKGTFLDGIFKGAGNALNIVDAATKLYKLSQAVSIGVNAIDARSAADAALTQCKKPKEPELPDTATPELKRHPPKSHQPDRPPPLDPDPPPPPQHIPLGKALMKWASKQGTGG